MSKLLGWIVGGIIALFSIKKSVGWYFEEHTKQIDAIWKWVQNHEQDGKKLAESRERMVQTLARIEEKQNNIDDTFDAIRKMVGAMDSRLETNFKLQETVGRLSEENEKLKKELAVRHGRRKGDVE